MDIQFMKDYYDLRYEETDGENHFVEETAYQEKQSEQSKMEDQLSAPRAARGARARGMLQQRLHPLRLRHLQRSHG